MTQMDEFTVQYSPTDWWVTFCRGLRASGRRTSELRWFDKQRARQMQEVGTSPYVAVAEIASFLPAGDT